MSAPITTPARAPQRIVSLDQFRGYTVAGMFLVNFIGGFAVTLPVLRHHQTYCSYADTIMPQFFFAVGFAFRLTFGRRAKLDGVASAYGHVIKRLLGLVLVALVVYQVQKPADTWEKLQALGVWGAIKKPLLNNWIQTLVHIALTSLWILPVIRAGVAVRVAFLIFSAVLHAVLTHLFYFQWCYSPIGVTDGGPLGFLTWSIPTLVGTFACDAVLSPGGPKIARIGAWALALMGLGYLFSCGTRLYDVPPEQVESLENEKLAPDPVIPSLDRFGRARSWRSWLAEPPLEGPPSVQFRKLNYWMMSQRVGTISYLTFSAGFSLGLYLLFYIVCDMYGWQLGFFRTLGVNALAGYVLHGWVGDAVEKFIPKNAPEWYVWSGVAVYFLVVYIFLRYLEKHKIYLKL